ncbi:MAG: tetratricopeptide repeat protein [Kofleriaceae bacterium]|nr:tetratricopeptide repeat protein [Kofleriaceae bacterium]MCL4223140.1 tetratricopeptide repeat protein [Myxococcales bacterium]
MKVDLTSHSAVAAAIVVMLLAANHVAHAQPADGLADPTDPVAMRHLNQGRKYFDTEEWDLAIKEFKAAALIEPVPKLFFNLGQANRFAGNYDEARRHFLRFLDKTARMKGRDIEAIRQTAEQLAADMEAAASREPTGTVPPNVEPVGAERPAAPAASVVPEVHRPDDRRDVVASGPRRRWLAYSLLAGGALAGLGAGGAYLAAESKEDEANAELVRSERDRLFEQSDSRRTIGHVCAVVGGAAVLGGVLVLVLDRGSGHPSRGPSVSFTVGSSWTGVAASLPF